MLTRARLAIRSILLRRRLEREMQEEMAEHLDRATARLMARGLSPEEARREAIREFGSVSYHQEEARLARGTGWLDALIADTRFGLRHFGRRPGTTIAIVVVLALDMGIATNLFSFLHSYSVQPPPGIARADDLVRIRGSQTSAQGLGSRGFSHDELQEYQSLTDHFRDVAGWADDGVVLDVEGDEERQALSAIATESYFTLLGVRPILGAGLPTAESAAGATAPVAVISHAAWDQLFGRSPDVVGATLKVNGVPVTIVGVAPPRFNGMTMISVFKLWLPLAHRPLLVPNAERVAEGFRAAARLRPGVSLDAATAAVRVVAARAAAEIEEPAERPYERRLTIDTRVVPLTAGSGDPRF
ncbi:hypothetical protein BH24GEM3_BH24GEM3_07620 [soil metagenome]